jgi:hypothetical protein
MGCINPKGPLVFQESTELNILMQKITNLSLTRLAKSVGFQNGTQMGESLAVPLEFCLSFSVLGHS